MNVIHYNSPFKTLLGNQVVFCCVDHTDSYKSAWATELIKNIADYTISNLTIKGYQVLQSFSEDYLLREAVKQGFEYAVVYSTGTEFINGDTFFENIDSLISTDFFIAGHILDRNDAFYELHSQCYVINLKIYAALGFQKIGQQELGVKHVQQIPNRSKENIHDDYTPIWIKSGSHLKDEYQHKAHGWNILSLALTNNYPVIVFSDAIRNSKKYYYPESSSDFMKHIAWAYMRHNYCLTEFVHTSNTESLLLDDSDFTQVLAPASGTNFLKRISVTEPVTVTLYDYNQRALDYWQVHVPKIANVTYKFLKIDLLTDELRIQDILDTTAAKTLVNLSNIFCYEATAPFFNLAYRLRKENDAIENVKKFIPDSYVYFSSRACTGFSEVVTNEIVELHQLTTPTWHTNADWQ
jgi:hypothetical protein